eukprot:TRINITY_DN1154_c0_g1_i1.p1 TRINITY_DN1154_c0_g1~~TRINITY_DN1154_c0_g1_i1.p1  ORF type:complete len:244 (-),score=68.78 TRINITY_DN1154_c0_g1_i1:66-797(-)
MVDTEESIYNLIPKPEETVAKSPLYKTKFAKESGSTSTSSPKKSSTIGPAKVAPPSPSNFLKKGTSMTASTAPMQTMERSIPKQPKEKTKPAVPKRSEKPVMGLITNKNFIKENKSDAAKAGPPPKPEEMDYLKKEDYGQVPDYLHEVKAQIGEEQKAELERTKQREKAARGGMRELTEDEKSELISGLRERWDAINKVYAQLPVAIHTVSQKQRKEDMERQLHQIEKDIDRLSKKNVYIQDE